MGVYIPGMKMPVKCALCDAAFPDGVGWSCPLIKGRPNIDNQKGRRKDCPLVPVPPHRRLGDLDAAAELAMQYCPDDDGSCSKAGADLRELLDEIETLPTIIPAEEGER